LSIYILFYIVFVGAVVDVVINAADKRNAIVEVVILVGVVMVWVSPHLAI
jgi:hypothetical protein